MHAVYLIIAGSPPSGSACKELLSTPEYGVDCDLTNVSADFHVVSKGAVLKTCKTQDAVCISILHIHKCVHAYRHLYMLY